MLLWKRLTHLIKPRRMGDVSPGDQNGQMDLVAATLRNNVAAVERLLDEGADVNLGNEEGKTALIFAAGGGDLDIVKILLKAGADINHQDYVFGWTALRSAALHGQAKVVDALLQAGADVDQQASHGSTALMEAAGGGHVRIVKKLLDAGADPDLQDDFTRTALRYAEDEGHRKIVAILRKQSSKVPKSSRKPTRKRTRPDVSKIPHELLGTHPDDKTGAPHGELGLGESNDGYAAMFVFDYDRMGSAYGAEAFAAIAECLEGSTGICAFLDGDLEEAAGGPSRVPALLMEIRDKGWHITSHRADSPLVLLAVEDHIYAYAAALWTDNVHNIQKLHDHLCSALPEAYLGYLDNPASLDMSKFRNIISPLNLPVRVTFSNGVVQ